MLIVRLGLIVRIAVKVFLQAGLAWLTHHHHLELDVCLHRPSSLERSRCWAGSYDEDKAKVKGKTKRHRVAERPPHAGPTAPTAAPSRRASGRNAARHSRISAGRPASASALIRASAASRSAELRPAMLPM